MTLHSDFEVKNGMVMVPMDVFLSIEEQLEALEDIHAYDTATANPSEGFPIEVVQRQLNGENTLRVIREYRGLTQKDLAQKASISQVMISGMESGKKSGTIATYKAIANALDIDLDELV